MALISCEFYKGYYYFIIYWVSEIIRPLIGSLLNEPNISNNKDKDKNEELIYNIEEELLKLIKLNIADLLTGFLVLYTRNSMKSLNKKKNIKKINIKNKKKNLESSLIYNERIKIKHKYYLIAFTSLLDFIASSVYFFSALTKKPKPKISQTDWLLSIDIIARIIFCIVFLKITIRKHHKLSILMCMIGFVLMSISDFISISKSPIDNSDVILYIVIVFPKTILFPLSDVFNKKLLTNDYLLPHSLIFWRGICQFWVFFIIVPVLYLKDIIRLDNMNEFKKIKKIIYSLLFIIISFFRNLCLMNVIYCFNSHYVSFLLVIIIFDNTIREFFEEDNIYDLTKIKGIMFLIVDIISLLLIAFGTLIFNEVIIINACQLNEKTKKGLLINEKNDSNTYESFYYNDDDEYVENEENNGHLNQSNNDSVNNNLGLVNAYNNDSESKDDSF